jgi:hypothetical protein
MNLKGISGHAPVIEIKTARDGRFLKGQIHSFIQQKGIGPRRDRQNSVARQIKLLSEQDIPHSQARITSRGEIRNK